MTPATLALEAVLQILEDATIAATRDAGAFHPQPIGVLVGLPSLTGRTLGGRVFTVPVFVVAGEPMNSAEAVDRMYSTADDIAAALDIPTYRPTTWGGGPNAEPLSAVELLATITTEEE